jgi:phosphopantetheinyl transferase
MIYIVRHPTRLAADFWQQALSALDTARQEHTLRWRAQRDRNLSVLGYLLLRFGLLREYGWRGLPHLLYNQWGKPSLPEGLPYFSLSYCPQAVVCALDSLPVGVDVAEPAAFDAMMQPALLAKIYSAAEIAVIQRARAQAQTACILWAAKESLCKYTGKGLTWDMPQVLCRALPALALHGSLAQLPLKKATGEEQSAASALKNTLRLDGISFVQPALEIVLCRKQRQNLAAPLCHAVSPEQLEQLFF